jgi:hypothetical protein
MHRSGRSAAGYRTCASFLPLALFCLACHASSHNGSHEDFSDAGPKPFDSELSLPAETIDSVPGWRLESVEDFGYGYILDIETDDRSLWLSAQGGVEEFYRGETSIPRPSCASGKSDMVLARYDGHRALEWLGCYDGLSHFTPGRNAPNRSGAFAAAGSVWPTPTGIRFGSDPSADLALGFSGDRWIGFFLLYAADGRLRWMRQPYASESDCPNSNACWTRGTAARAFSNGRAVFGGIIKGDMLFGRSEPGETRLVTEGGEDTFIASFFADGALAWVRQMSTVSEHDGDEAISSIVELPGGDLVINGSYAGELVLGEGEPNETVLRPTDESSVFVARYREDGTLVWARDLGIDGSAMNGDGGELRLLRDGSLGLAGRFFGAIPSGDAPHWQVVETPVEGRGGFLAKLTASGERLWSRVWLSEEFLSAANGVAELSDGSLAVVGRYEGAATFDPGGPRETRLPFRGGHYDAFLALYSATGDLQWVLSMGGSRDDACESVGVMPDPETGLDAIFTGCRFDGAIRIGTGGGDEIVLDEFEGDYRAILMRFVQDATPE